VFVKRQRILGQICFSLTVNETSVDARMDVIAAGASIR
jgi:hypothetical protein